MKYSTLALLIVGSVSAEQSLLDLQAAQGNKLAFAGAESLIEDATNVQLTDDCVYLDETNDELQYQVDMFSRTLDLRHWTNIQNLLKALKKKQNLVPKFQVHTWELYDGAFSFPRVANTVRSNFNTKYHDGEFDDPAAHDPKVE